MVIDIDLFSCEDSGTDICSGRNLSDPEYSDYFVVLNEDPSWLSTILDCVGDNVDICHAKCKILFLEWIDSKPILVLTGEQLSEVDGFSHLDNCISPGGLMSEVSSHAEKTRLLFINLRRLWRYRDIQISTKHRVCASAMRPIGLYGSEAWAL